MGEGATARVVLSARAQDAFIRGWITLDVEQRVDLDGVVMDREGQETVFHSDRGSAYTSAGYRALVAGLGMRSSMGRTGVSLLTGYSTRDPWWRHADALRVPRRSDARVQHVSHDGQGSPVARAA